MSGDADFGAELPEGSPEQAWKVLGLVNDWVRHAETKLGLTFAATGVTATVFIAVIRDWLPHWTVLVLGLIAAGVLLSTGWACVMGLVPRRWSTTDDGFLAHLEHLLMRTAEKLGRRTPAPSQQADPANLIFYTSIVEEYGPEGCGRYQKDVNKLLADAPALVAAVSQQAWANAQVAERKFTWANRAVWRLAAAWLLVAILGALRAVGL